MSLFKLILFIICFLIFLYQFVDITHTYLQYETITNIDYNDDSLPMPALFTCFQHPFAARQMLKELNINVKKELNINVEKESKTNTGSKELNFSVINVSNSGSINFDSLLKRLDQTPAEFYRMLASNYTRLLQAGKCKELLEDVSFTSDVSISLEEVDLYLKLKNKTVKWLGENLDSEKAEWTRSQETGNKTKTSETRKPESETRKTKNETRKHKIETSEAGKPKNETRKLFSKLFRPETYLHYGKKQQKCFSYFGHPKNYSLVANKNSAVKLVIKNANLMPIDSEDVKENPFYSKLLFTVVGNRAVPRARQMELLDISSIVDVTLSITVIKSMKAPYKTRCQYYQKEVKNQNSWDVAGNGIDETGNGIGETGSSFDETGNTMETKGNSNGVTGNKIDETGNRIEETGNHPIGSRSQCIARCIFTHSNQNTTPNDPLDPINDYLINSDWLRQNQKIRSFYQTENYSLPSKDLKLKIERSCERLCPLDCHQIFYKLGVSKTNNLRTQDTVVWINPNALNIRISHQPETTFLSFVGTVGGLAGIWLGLSCYGIFSDSFQLMNKRTLRRMLNWCGIRNRRIRGGRKRGENRKRNSRNVVWISKN